MVEIKAGVELDRAVAEAIGWRIEACRPLDWIGSNGVSVEEFRPSVDLNWAFAAAEKVGLFDRWVIGQWSNPPQSGWGIEGDDSPVTSLYPTPALAICAAILALGKESES